MVKLRAAFRIFAASGASSVALTHGCFIDTDGYGLRHEPPDSTSADSGTGGSGIDASAGGTNSGGSSGNASGGASDAEAGGIGGATGGATSTGGIGGATGGATSTGGIGGAGGNPGTGGNPGSGGESDAGAGGNPATGGSPSTGGAGGASTGGSQSSGGALGAGGNGAGGTGTGGANNTGGAGGVTGGPVGNPCGAGCDGTLADCNGQSSDGFEANLATDPANCGACAFDCGGGACKNGVCTGIVLNPPGSASGSSLRLDDTRLFWLHAPVDSMPKTGGAITPLASGQGYFSSIALDTDHVYWTLQGGTAGTGAVLRVKKDGSGFETLVPNLTSPKSVSVDGPWVYWSDGGTVSRVQIGQAVVFPLATNASGVVSSGGTAYYQAGGASGSLWALATGATAATELLKPVGPTAFMKVVKGRLYFHPCPSLVCTGALTSLPVTGGTPITYSPPNVDDYDADGDFIYATSSQGMQIVPWVSGPALILGDITASTIAVDDAFIYYMRSSTHDVVRMPKPLFTHGAGGCAPGTADCNGGTDGCETDVWGDSSNCGVCGQSCGAASCVGGACKADVFTKNPSCGGQGQGLAADANFLYWRTGTAINKVPLGPGVTTPLVTGLPSVFSTFAFDGSYVYYADAGGNIVRLSTAGGSPTVVVPGAGIASNSPIVLEGGDVFWVSSTAGIESAPIAGGAIRSLAPETRVVADVYADASNVYWIVAGGTAGDGTVSMVHRDGTGLRTVASSLLLPRGLTGDATYIYWTTNAGEVMRALRDGSQTSQVSWGPRTTSEGLTIHGGYLYWSSGAQILRAPVTGGPPTILVDGAGEVSRTILFLGSDMYWSGCEFIYRSGF